MFCEPEAMKQLVHSKQNQFVMIVTAEIVSDADDENDFDRQLSCWRSHLFAMIDNQSQYVCPLNKGNLLVMGTTEQLQRISRSLHTSYVSPEDSKTIALKYHSAVMSDKQTEFILSFF